MVRIQPIAASKALMRYRREKLREWEPLEENVAQQPTDVPLAMDLEAALARLPDRSRAVVWLLGLEERQTKETARILNLSEAAVKARFLRARRKLRECLADRM